MPVQAPPAAQATTQDTIEPVAAPAVRVTLDRASLTLSPGARAHLKAEIQLADGKSRASGLTWRSDNEQIATVDAAGLVTGLKKGVAFVSAIADENSARTAVARVAVE